MSGFRRAKSEQAALKIGMYGPPGSGKTFTSLLMAEGLAKRDGKRIAFVDTEYGTSFYCKDVPTRRCHPEAFDFDAIYTKSISEILSEIKKLKPADYGVVVIDSITHVWEACRLAYEGKQTSAGTIPMHAWGKIKKPYKELMAILLSSPMHVLLCGRQGTEYATDDETDEIKAVGVKMKAEGETPYEPHILIRMESERKKGKGEGTIAAFVEKDRTGVLAGKVFQMPTFDMLCAPILPLLGGTQARVPTEDETAATDAVALSDADRAKQERSEQLYRDAAAMFDLAKTPEELEKSSKNVTKDMKSEMVPAHVTQLREKYLERSKALGNVA